MKDYAFLSLKYIVCTISVTPIIFFLLVNNPANRGGVLLADLNDFINEKDIHSSFEESNDSFFPSNPVELMNVLRSIESAKDGTSPSDAIDAALNAFENEEKIDSAFERDRN